MNNAVVYARFSSHSQNEQSIEGQMKECRAFAERYGYKIIGEYIDRALTGTTDKRPEFLRMIEDSRKKQFQFVIVYQLDRFARNRYDSATYKAKLKKNGVRVLSAKENITDDASGVLVEGVLESMAEYYSLELSQKIKRGIGISASKCKFFGGSIALGYKVDEEKNYVVDEHTAPLVKTVFEMFVGGHNYATKIKNRRDLIDTLIYKVILYDDKMKILFNLKGGQKGELLLNLIFPDYPDGDDHNGTYDGGSDKNGGDGNHGGLGDGAHEKTGLNEKETSNAVSLSERCAYTSRVVEIRGFEPLTCTLRTYRSTN
ncbi:hypothetical protein FACS1894211_15530 [Clostridia bacterium]|nr:hypothetical protein FACS1894211_15530 [Clostridia bacterium]